MELLNLDALASVSRFVTIKGVDYQVANQTVDQMLASIGKAKKAVEGRQEQSPEEVLREMKEACMTILPDCPEKVLGGLSIRQLGALLEFASKPDSEVEAEVQSATEGEAQVGKSK